METLLHQYFYHKGKITAKAVIYSIVSALAVAFGVFCYVRWEMDFLFTDWKGYVILIVYGVLTLGMILSAVEAFKKLGKANRGIPAFGVGPDCFVLYDSAGLATAIPFERCERVRFKSEYRYRGAAPRLTLIITHHDQAAPDASTCAEIPLYELDRPQREIDRQLKKVYQAYKKTHTPQSAN